MLKENVIVLYIRKDHINIAIIRRIGEARTLVPKYGFQLQEVDITHDYVKQKELHQTHNAANEYPHFQYYKDKENIYHIGNLDSLRAFLLSPPPSILALHDSDDDDDDDEGEEIELHSDKHSNNVKEGEREDESKEEEEREPALGFISQSLQTVEGVVKYSTSWLTSWFYTPPVITPLSNNNNNSDNDNIEKKDNDNDNDDDKDKEDTIEKKVKEGGEEEKIKDFKVVQTNWYWRQQNRVLRFDLNNEQTIYRYDPLDNSIRAIHPFSLLRDVTCYTSQSFFQLSFAKSSSDPSLVYEYYTTSSSDFPLILSLLTSHSSVSPNVNP